MSGWRRTVGWLPLALPLAALAWAAQPDVPRSMPATTETAAAPACPSPGEAAPAPLIRIGRIALPPPRPVMPPAETVAEPVQATGDPLVRQAGHEEQVAGRTADPQGTAPSRPEDRASIPASPVPVPQPAEGRAPAAAPLRLAGPADAAAGRPLLRLVELGRGPAIRLDWPDDPADGDRLYAVLARCHGVRTVLADAAGMLYGPDGAPGRPMTLDTDRISGFVRTLDGELTAAERRLVPALRQRHGRADLVPVRLFGRGFDAQLLGALSRAAGTDAGAGRAASVAARLRIEGTSVIVEAVRVAGRAVPLRISIPAPRGCRPGAT